MLDWYQTSSDHSNHERDFNQILRELVAHHTILPARALLLSATSDSGSRSSETPTNLMDSFLAPIMPDLT